MDRYFEPVPLTQVHKGRVISFGVGEGRDEINNIRVHVFMIGVVRVKCWCGGWDTLPVVRVMYEMTFK